MKETDKIEKRDGTTIYNGPVGAVINSGRDTKTGNITNNPAPPSEASEKKKSLQDIIANPATIASFIIALVVIYLTLPTNIALILIIIAILIFVFLVALNPKKG
jgi:magnesium-transporting ATPase (P-type)